MRYNAGALRALSIHSDDYISMHVYVSMPLRMPQCDFSKAFGFL